MNKGQRIWKWDLEKRLRLQAMLHEGYNLAKVREIWERKGIYPELPTLNALCKEVKLGLTDKESEMKQYVKYDVVRVYSNLLGNETLKWLVKQMDQE